MSAQSFHLQVIELLVKNVEQSMKWYMDMFDLKLCFPYNKGDDAVCLNLNGMGFMLVHSHEIPKLEFI